MEFKQKKGIYIPPRLDKNNAKLTLKDIYTEIYIPPRLDKN